MDSTRAAAYSHFVVHHPWMVAFLSIGLSVFLLSGLRNLAFTNEYRYFFTEDNPYLKAFEQLERTYSSPDNVMFVVQSTQEKATSPKMLKLIDEITTASWQIPYSTRVDSLTNFQNTRAFGDDLVVSDLVPSADSLDSNISLEVETIALSEPLLKNRLLSSDARTTAINIHIRPPPDDVNATLSIVSAVRAIQDRVEKEHPEVRVELTGMAMLANAFFSAGQHDIRTLTPVMFLIIGGVLLLVTMQIFATLGTLLVVGISAVSALGVAGWIGIPMSPPSSGASVIILTVAVADCVHILVSAMVAQSKGLGKKDALVESLKINMQPIFLTSVTTAIGLASLNFSDAPPYRDLGTLAASGALVAWFLSMTLFPALLSIIPLKPNQLFAKQGFAMAWLAENVIRYRKILLPSMLFIIVGTSAMIPRLVFNDRFVEYFDEEVDFRIASQFTVDNLTGVYLLNFSIKSDEAGGISDPDYLAYLDKFSSWLRQQPEVLHVASYTDVIKRINRSMNGDYQQFYRIPDSRDLAAQYLLLYEMSLPYGLDLNDQINIDKSATRLVVALENVGTQEMKALRSRTTNWMSSNGPAYRVVEPSGQAVMFTYIGERNFQAMMKGTLCAFLLISLCLFITLRSLRLGIISLIPNITPPIVAIGFFAIFNDYVGLWTSFVVATAIGLIVDATVHMLSKYQHARMNLQYDPINSVRYSFSTVGAALTIASVILILGFLVLSTSPFFINAMTGLIVAMTIAAALVLDFLLLPPLLLLFDKASTET